MKYKAVIFDLFGTLVDVVSTRELRNELAEMASVLSIPPVSFTQLWLESSDQRSRGVFRDIEANIRYITDRLGFCPSDEQISCATKLRYDYPRRILAPRTDAIAVLSRLKSEGYKIGLTSDCSIGVPVIWQETPFVSLVDKAVFSCLVGLKKPAVKDILRYLREA